MKKKLGAVFLALLIGMLAFAGSASASHTVSDSAAGTTLPTARNIVIAKATFNAPSFYTSTSETGAFFGVILDSWAYGNGGYAIAGFHGYAINGTEQEDAYYYFVPAGAQTGTLIWGNEMTPGDNYTITIHWFGGGVPPITPEPVDCYSGCYEYTVHDNTTNVDALHGYDHEPANTWNNQTTATVDIERPAGNIPLAHFTNFAYTAQVENASSVIRYFNQISPSSEVMTKTGADTSPYACTNANVLAYPVGAYPMANDNYMVWCHAS